MSELSNRLNTGILGASGYTGAELVRLLSRHPQVRLSALTADRHAGKPMADVFPQFHGMALPQLERIESIDWSSLDVVLCALPHGTTQEVIAGLPEHLKVVDLSADFRLSDIDVYAEWYGHEHKAPALQATAVYGLTEIMRDKIADARLVANPGCYPTAAQLPLIPLLEASLIEPDDIAIDAKSGVSGAGRGTKEGSLYAEVTEGIHAYALSGHRHAPEIEQGLSLAAGTEVKVAFVPHLMPMSRGILTTTYVRLVNGYTPADLRANLSERYGNEPFVQVLEEGAAPATRHVRGSNLCRIGVIKDRRPGRAILVAAIDNLVKGASGQAVQNMNVMCGFAETEALEAAPIFP